MIQIIALQKKWELLKSATVAPETWSQSENWIEISPIYSKTRRQSYEFSIQEDILLIF